MIDVGVNVIVLELYPFLSSDDTSDDMCIQSLEMLSGTFDANHDISTDVR